MSGICAFCGGDATKRCGGCKFVYYCCRSCQTSHWLEHKKDCGQVRTIIGGSKTILIPKTAPEYVESHAIQNEKLINLAIGALLQHRQKIEEIHKRGSRCFFNLEVAPGVQSLEIISASIDDASAANIIADQAGSTKLVSFCNTYDKRVSIPIIVWCRKPWSCYTFLPVVPWKNSKFAGNY